VPRIELDREFQIQDGKEMRLIRIMLFGCTWNLLLESNGDAQFHFMFGCKKHGIGLFVEFGQYKLLYMYEK
jgi:hypothetical protein